MGNFALNAARAYVPYVAEAEATLVGSAFFAHGLGLAKTSAALAGAADFVPVVGGSMLSGAIAGNAVEMGLEKAGAPKLVAEGGGVVSALIAGAGAGALIGMGAGGVGAGPGAVVGGLVGVGAYLWSKGG